MTSWTPRLDPERPRYLAIAEAMRSDLLTGKLKAGERVPTHRDLAYRLGVTTGTVTRAYAEAEKLGILVGEVGRGSFLKEPAKPVRAFESSQARNDDVADLTQASPPMIHEAQDLDAALRQVMQQPSRIDLLDYTPPEGHPLHRAMGVTWLKRSGISVSEDQVVVTAGAHAALIACLSALSQHGENMFVEGMNYPTIKPIARHVGLTMVPLESDAQGLVPESFERASKAGEARLLYLVPTLHNPTTVTLDLNRRTAIVEIARRYGVTIIEDDIFRLLDPRLQPPTLYTLAPERTYYITSVSKTLAPGLRVGFVATPEGKTDQLIRHQTIASGRAVGLAAEVARLWIESDIGERILTSIIEENAARRSIALEVFRRRDVLCKPGAPYLWLKLPENWPPGEFARSAQDRGVRVTSGPLFAADRRVDDAGVRVCFGGRITREGLRKACLTLNALLDELPDDEFHSVA
ncbi:PLP-dependent aminotransferase family protein [Aestuariivirga sp.]|uniref:aminotransferase-like domain-containing protein n=1 Tax=Aestuariivirga sp. TaxID=2650926 RepID=UPI0039E329B4